MEMLVIVPFSGMVKGMALRLALVEVLEYTLVIPTVPVVGCADTVM
jgi:hypothetical protein